MDVRGVPVIAAVHDADLIHLLRLDRGEGQGVTLCANWAVARITGRMLGFHS